MTTLFARLHSPAAVACLLLMVQGAEAAVEYDPDKMIESANLYGNLNQYGYYFLDLLVGTPSNQRASVIVDTGSRLVGFPCKGCQHCGEHLDEAYDISHSSTARWLGCEDSTCNSDCVNDHCAYAETYSEGSSISGFLFEDEVELGDSLHHNPPVKALLGCHMNENKLFYSQRANGIMGLAPGSSGDDSRPNILTQLFADKAHVKTSMFSMCLATWGGVLTVGGINTSYHSGGGSNEDNIQWIRLLPDSYYFLFPVGVTIGSTSDSKGLSAAWGQNHLGVTILDSGTSFSYFPGPLYHAILNRIAEYCESGDGCGARKIDVATEEGSECWLFFDANKGPVDFPSIRLHFDEDTRVDWHPTEFLQKRDDRGVWCTTFLENNIFQTVLGISFMLHRDVIFDLGGQRLGLAEADCPEHKQPPAAPRESSRTSASPSLVPHRLYSIDNELAARVGYLVPGHADPSHSPLAFVSDQSAVSASAPRRGLAAAGALCLVAAVAVLGAVHLRRRRHPAHVQDESLLSCATPDDSTSVDLAAEASGDGFIGVAVCKH